MKNEYGRYDKVRFEKFEGSIDNLLEPGPYDERALISKHLVRGMSPLNLQSQNTKSTIMASSSSDSSP